MIVFKFSFERLFKAMHSNKNTKKYYQLQDLYLLPVMIWQRKWLLLIIVNQSSSRMCSCMILEKHPKTAITSIKP